jgi:hypothetical protein
MEKAQEQLSSSSCQQCQFSLFEIAPWVPLFSIALRSREIHKNGDIGCEPDKSADAHLHPHSTFDISFYFHTDLPQIF